MKVSDLSPAAIGKIKALRYDQLLEKHEGPWRWESEFEYGNPEFMQINGRDVLLPVSPEQHPNITILRAIMSDNGNAMTIFLKDTTYWKGQDEFFAGRFAFCDKLPGENFFVATVYHEWFLIPDQGQG